MKRGEIFHTRKKLERGEKMKEMPVLFRRRFGENGEVELTREVTPGCEWVLEGLGEATEKVDGSAVALIDGVWYKRFDAKKGRRVPPGAIACEPKADPVTGHWPHWIPADLNGKQNKRLKRAVDNTPWAWAGVSDGTFELVGRHINRNPYRLDDDFLERHGRIKLPDCPRDYDGLREYLSTHMIEGVVFWKDGEPKCKIRRKDFGFEWPVRCERDE